MGGEAEILFEVRGAIGIVTLNRPKALNALTHAMCVEMDGHLAAWSSDASISAVVVRGAGDRAFCAGGDIRALYESGKAHTPYALEFYRDEYRLNARIKHFTKPYVALLHGIVMGGGVGVSVHGSHRVAGENAVFAMPETGIGLFPDVGGSYFLPRCPGEIGMYCALTGARLKVADMLHAGVATHVVPIADWDQLIDRLVGGEDCEHAIANLSVAAESPSLAGQRMAIDGCFAGPTVESILAALDEDDSDWGRSTAAIIRAKSPTSLKLSHRQLRKGRELSFDECMRMEFRMVNRIIAGHDFYEGVRAAIIDKDNMPRWRPGQVSDVGDEAIDAYFAPLGGNELSL